MHSKGLGDCARQLLKEVATVRSMDVVLPVKETQSQQMHEVRLRVVARLDLNLPSAPKVVQNVVEKNGL